ncbi:MAG TPA: hypothetical protein VE620_11675 [Myxococcales bacterium]|nr:hypothetical protein [Myxococcales bacterium]
MEPVVPLWPEVEPVFVLFWSEVPTWPLLLVCDVSLDFAVALPDVVPVDPLADADVSPVDPCVATCPWLPVALWVP